VSEQPSSISCAQNIYSTKVVRSDESKLSSSPSDPFYRGHIEALTLPIQRFRHVDAREAPWSMEGVLDASRSCGTNMRDIDELSRVSETTHYVEQYSNRDL
jgi:hypothetical protein